MKDTTTEARAQLALMLLIAAVTGAAFWVAEGASSGLTAAGLMTAFAAVVHAGRRRNPTLEAVGGIGDERTRALYERASGFAGNVVAAVILAWWLVTLFEGDADETLTVLAAVFGASFLAATAVLQRRG